MKVIQALKKKNKLVEALQKQYQIAQKYNSTEEGGVIRYVISETLDKARKIVDELTELKTKIHLANGSVYNKIFLLGELKTRANMLKKIPTDEGSVTAGYSSVVIKKEVSLNVLDLDKMLVEVQEEIENLQNELDIHNSTVDI